MFAIAIMEILGVITQLDTDRMGGDYISAY